MPPADHPGHVLESWESALAENKAIPTWDRLSANNLEICLPSGIKRALVGASRFAIRESECRRATNQTPEGWQRLCNLTSGVHHLYTPRWSFPVFYFPEETRFVFSGLCGLDVGARVSSKDNLFKRGPLRLSTDNPLLRETFVPHWKYYEVFGARMHAIDLYPDPVESRVAFGDARLLDFPNESFDFLTLPMLLGPGNPCATALEIAFCVAEIHRVLRSGGFAYIADAIVQPCVCFTAQINGFKVTCTKGSGRGGAIGTILFKYPGPAGTGVLAGAQLSQALKPHDLCFMSDSDEIVSHCNLIEDCCEPAVGPGFFEAE
jgi:SAM-dependent methyltransferase